MGSLEPPPPRRREAEAASGICRLDRAVSRRIDEMRRRGWTLREGCAPARGLSFGMTWRWPTCTSHSCIRNPTTQTQRLTNLTPSNVRFVIGVVVFPKITPGLVAGFSTCRGGRTASGPP